MKKWLSLLYIGFSLTISISAHALDKIAIINMDYLIQHVAKKTDISTTLENEFKDRINELKIMENDMQSKIQRLQYDGYNMKAIDRNKLEKDVVFQRQNFSQKAQAFELDHQRRSNEEHSKLVAIIQEAVRSVATDQHIDLVIDANAITFNNSYIKDITADVLKQVK